MYFLWDFLLCYSSKSVSQILPCGVSLNSKYQNFSDLIQFLDFPCGLAVKNPPSMQETWVLPLDQEDPLGTEWQHTPIYLPGEPHRQRSLVAYSPQGQKESDTIEVTQHTSKSSSYILVTVACSYGGKGSQKNKYHAPFL